MAERSKAPDPIMPRAPIRWRSGGSRRTCSNVSVKPLGFLRNARTGISGIVGSNPTSDNIFPQKSYHFFFLTRDLATENIHGGYSSLK